MTTKKYYYKAVYAEKGKLLSWHMGRFPKTRKSLKVEYELNKWAYPKLKNTKLLIFNTLENATSFIGRFDPIYKCIVKNPKKQEKILCSGSIANNHFSFIIIRKFWKSQTGLNPFDFQDSPIGSYKCDAVKLIKRVQ